MVESYEKKSDDELIVERLSMIDEHKRVLNVLVECQMKDGTFSLLTFGLGLPINTTDAAIRDLALWILSTSFVFSRSLLSHATALSVNDFALCEFCIWHLRADIPVRMAMRFALWCSISKHFVFEYCASHPVPETRHETKTVLHNPRKIPNRWCRPCLDRCWVCFWKYISSFEKLLWIFLMWTRQSDARFGDTAFVYTVQSRLLCSCWHARLDTLQISFPDVNQHHVATRRI